MLSPLESEITPRAAAAKATAVVATRNEGNGCTSRNQPRSLVTSGVSGALWNALRFGLRQRLGWRQADRRPRPADTRKEKRSAGEDDGKHQEPRGVGDDVVHELPLVHRDQCREREAD